MNVDLMQHVIRPTIPAQQVFHAIKLKKVSYLENDYFDLAIQSYKQMSPFSKANNE